MALPHLYESPSSTSSTSSSALSLEGTRRLINLHTGMGTSVSEQGTARRRAGGWVGGHSPGILVGEGNYHHRQEHVKHCVACCDHSLRLAPVM